MENEINVPVKFFEEPIEAMKYDEITIEQIESVEVIEFVDYSEEGEGLYLCKLNLKIQVTE